MCRLPAWCRGCQGSVCAVDWVWQWQGCHSLVAHWHGTGAALRQLCSNTLCSQVLQERNTLRARNSRRLHTAILLSFRKKHIVEVLFFPENWAVTPWEKLIPYQPCFLRCLWQFYENMFHWTALLTVTYPGWLSCLPRVLKVRRVSPLSVGTWGSRRAEPGRTSEFILEHVDISPAPKRQRIP